MFSYLVQDSKWDRYGPHNLDNTIPIDINAKAMYLYHPPGHYNLVGSTVKPPSSRPQNPLMQQYNVETLARTEWSEYRFCCVDEQWQQDACNRLGLPFYRASGMGPGGPTVNLRRPGRTRNIQGDGNCLFRCFSYIITGSEQHYREIRSAIVAHLPNIEHILISESDNIHNVDDYLRRTRMNRNATWGTEKEVWALAHMLNTPVYAYKADENSWFYQNPQTIDPDNLFHFITDPAIYLVNANNHYTPVMSISPGATGTVQPTVPTVTVTVTPSVTTAPTVTVQPTETTKPTVPTVTVSVQPSVTTTVTVAVQPSVTTTPTVTVQPTVTTVPTVTVDPAGRNPSSIFHTEKQYSSKQLSQNVASPQGILNTYRSRQG